MAAPLTDVEHQQIAELFWSMVDGRKRPTLKAVAAKAGRSTKAVKRSLELARIVEPTVAVSAAQRQRIIDLYQTRRNGRWLSTAAVGKIVGRGATTVFAVVKDAGVLRSRSEAATLHVPAETRERVLRLRRATGWGWEKVSAALNVKPTVVRKVFEEADVFVPAGPNSRARVTAAEAEVIVGLYRQGQPAEEVAKRTGRDKTTVTAFVRAAGALRTFAESNSLAQLRLSDRRWLASVDVVPLAERWLAGAEVEDLAAELTVAADLLWDKLAEAIADMRPPAVDDAGRCAGCPFACAAVCARRMTPITAPELPAAAPRLATVAVVAAPRTRRRRRSKTRLTQVPPAGEAVAVYRWTGTNYTKITDPPENPQVDSQVENTDVVVRADRRGAVTFGPSGFGWTIH